jgi:hypothetical protein
MEHDMSDFTPGPWRAVQDAAHEGNKRIYARPYEAVAKVYALEPKRDDAKAEANARLIAAAPELYEALERVSQALLCIAPNRSGDAESKSAALKIADAVLAKARGEQVSA